MQFNPVKFSERYSIEWFALKAMSKKRKLNSKVADESYWIYLLKKYPGYEQNIFEAKEMIDVLSNVRVVEFTPQEKASVWRKIVQQIKDQGI